MFAPGLGRDIHYYKRFRMERDLTVALPPSALPEGYTWMAWRPELLQEHADTKFNSFHEEIDSVVFPNLGDARGCRQLMQQIVNRSGFCPEATWLIRCGDGFCGTIQGVRERGGRGMIQNLGVLPLYRGQGLGAALLLQAMHGFQRTGLALASLEVTSENESAVRMYRRLGFRRRKTIYKAVDFSAIEADQPAALVTEV